MYRANYYLFEWLTHHTARKTLVSRVAFDADTLKGLSKRRFKRPSCGNLIFHDTYQFRKEGRPIANW